MKLSAKIYGVPTWVLGIFIIIFCSGLGWFALFHKSEPSNAAVECFKAARLMLYAERAERIERMTTDSGMSSKRAFDLADSSRRNYFKLFERLKEGESMWSRESIAIENWVKKGILLNNALPSSYNAAIGLGESALIENDLKWKIFYEEDIVDALRAVQAPK